jgi:hypothetical protein
MASESTIIKVKIYTVNGAFQSEFEVEGTVEDCVVI